MLHEPFVSHWISDSPLLWWVSSLKVLNPLLDRLEGLLSRLPSRLAKHQLALQVPSLRNTVLGLQTGINKRIVMLKVDTHSLSLESGPQHILMHAIGLVRPLWEFVLIALEFLLEFSHPRSIFVPQDGTVTAFEACHPAFGVLERLGR